MQDDIPLKAEVLLDPVSKYKIYGVFPWILFLHVMTVIFDSSTLISINNNSGELISA